MKTLAKIRLMSLALLALLLFSSAFISNQAQANFKPDVDIRVFHNALAPYGTWVNHQTYGQVWYPNGVDKNWRPYSDGHWAHTEQYGWLWVSNQKWGWAPFHYGRWSLDREYGWIWLPGRTWAPAWVFWRYGGGYAAWAPMPPNAVWESNVGLNTQYFNYDRDLPRHSWIAVHEYDIPHPYISRCYLPPRQNVQIFHVTHNINYVTIINKTIVNTGVPVKVIEKAMGHSVPFVKPVVIDDASKPVDNDSSKPIIIQPKDITSPSVEDNKKDMDLAKQLDVSSPVQSVNTPPANTDPKIDAITPGSPPLSGQPIEPLPVNNPNPTPVNSDILPPALGSATEATSQTEPPASTSAPIVPQQSVDPLSANLPATTPVNDGILLPAPASATEILPQDELSALAPTPIDPSLTPISPSIETGSSNPCTVDCVPSAVQSIPPAPEAVSTVVTPDSPQGKVINYEPLPGQSVDSLPVNNLNPTPATDDLSSPLSISNPLPETPSQVGSESTPAFQPVQPELQAQPEPSYQPEPQTQPEASYQPAPQAQPEPSYQPEPQAPPAPSYQPELQAQPEASYQPAPQAQPEPSYQPEPQAQPEPSYQPEPQAQPEPSYQSAPQAQPEPSYQSEPQAQPEPSYQPAPQAQPEPSPQPAPPPPAPEPVAQPAPAPQSAPAATEEKHCEKDCPQP